MPACSSIKFYREEEQGMCCNLTGTVCTVCLLHGYKHKARTDKVKGQPHHSDWLTPGYKNLEASENRMGPFLAISKRTTVATRFQSITAPSVFLVKRGVAPNRLLRFNFEAWLRICSRREADASLVCPGPNGRMYLKN